MIVGLGSRICVFNTAFNSISVRKENICVTTDHEHCLICRSYDHVLLYNFMIYYRIHVWRISGFLTWSTRLVSTVGSRNCLFLWNAWVKLHFIILLVLIILQFLCVNVLWTIFCLFTLVVAFNVFTSPDFFVGYFNSSLSYNVVNSFIDTLNHDI